MAAGPPGGRQCRAQTLQTAVGEMQGRGRGAASAPGAWMVATETAARCPKGQGAGGQGWRGAPRLRAGAGRRGTKSCRVGNAGLTSGSGRMRRQGELCASRGSLHNDAWTKTIVTWLMHLRSHNVEWGQEN